MLLQTNSDMTQTQETPFYKPTSVSTWPMFYLIMEV